VSGVSGERRFGRAADGNPPSLCLKRDSAGYHRRLAMHRQFATGGSPCERRLGINAVLVERH